MEVTSQPVMKEKVQYEEVGTEESSLHPDNEDFGCDSYHSKRKTDEPTHKFTHSEVFRLRHQLVIMLEELKLRKECEGRHDMKVKELLSQVYELEKAKDSLQHQLKQEEVRSNSAIAQVKQVREEQDVPVPNQQETSMDTNQSTDILKEEARKLQLINFQQERTINDLEAKIQSQASAAHQVMAQVSSLEEKLFSMKDSYQETSAYIGRLEATVEESRSMTCKLDYAYRHQKCLLTERESEVKHLKDSLLACKVAGRSPVEQVNMGRGGDNKESAGGGWKVDGLNRRVKELEACKDELEKELSEQTEKTQEALKRAQTAHSLVGQHLSNAVQHKEELDQLHVQCREKGAQCRRLEDQLEDAEGRLARLKGGFDGEKEQWKKQSNSLTQKVQELQDGLDRERGDKARIEETNGQLTAQNESLFLSLDQAKAKLDIDKNDTSSQTTTTMLHMADVEIQTCHDCTSNSSQTTQPVTNDGFTQTPTPPSYMPHTNLPTPLYVPKSTNTTIRSTSLPLQIKREKMSDKSHIDIAGCSTGHVLEQSRQLDSHCRDKTDRHKSTTRLLYVTQHQQSEGIPSYKDPVMLKAEMSGTSISTSNSIVNREMMNDYSVDNDTSWRLEHVQPTATLTPQGKDWSRPCSTQNNTTIFDAVDKDDPPEGCYSNLMVSMTSNGDEDFNTNDIINQPVMDKHLNNKEYPGTDSMSCASSVVSDTVIAPPSCVYNPSSVVPAPWPKPFTSHSLQLPRTSHPITDTIKSIDVVINNLPGNHGINDHVDDDDFVEPKHNTSNDSVMPVADSTMMSSCDPKLTKSNSDTFGDVALPSTTLPTLNTKSIPTATMLTCGSSDSLNGMPFADGITTSTYNTLTHDINISTTAPSETQTQNKNFTLEAGTLLYKGNNGTDTITDAKPDTNTTMAYIDNNVVIKSQKMSAFELSFQDSSHSMTPGMIVGHSHRTSPMRGRLALQNKGKSNGIFIHPEVPQGGVEKNTTTLTATNLPPSFSNPIIPQIASSSHLETTNTHTTTTTISTTTTSSTKESTTTLNPTPIPSVTKVLHNLCQQAPHDKKKRHYQKRVLFTPVLDNEIMGTPTTQVLKGILKVPSKRKSSDVSTKSVSFSNQTGSERKILTDNSKRMPSLSSQWSSIGSDGVSKSGATPVDDKGDSGSMHVPAPTTQSKQDPTTDSHSNMDIDDDIAVIIPDSPPDVGCAKRATGSDLGNAGSGMVESLAENYCHGDPGS